MKLEFRKGVYPEGSVCKNRREIGDFNTSEEMWNIIKKFLADHNFISYYSRIWFDEDENTVWIDVGSHTEFFAVPSPTKELLNVYKWG